MDKLLFLKSFPVEIVLEIYKNLDYPSILKFSGINKYFYNVFKYNQNAIFSSITTRDFFQLTPRLTYEILNKTLTIKKVFKIISNDIFHNKVEHLHLFDINLECYKQTPLLFALRKESVTEETINKILDMNPNVNKLESCVFNSLIRNNYYDNITNRLINMGAKVDCVVKISSKSETVIGTAIKFGAPMKTINRILNILVNKKSKKELKQHLNLRDIEHKTALEHAKEYDQGLSSRISRLLKK